MAKAQSYTFEPAPDLPGLDRINKYLFGGVRQLAPRLWDFEINGREHIPTDGPAIITPNHLSFCDSIFVPAALPRRVWAVGKGEYMDSWKTKHIFPAMGMIPVDRSGGDAAKAALDTAARVLQKGLLFMIYPEGTRSRSGNLHKGRTGAARLALQCNAPIVPVGHQGTVEVQPPDSVALKPRKKVVVSFGAPMWIGDFGDVNDPRTLRRFTDAVMFEIAQLSGQTYVDTYAGKDDKPADATTNGASTAPRRPDRDRPRLAPSTPSVVGTRETIGVPTGAPMQIRPPAGRATVPNRHVSASGAVDPIDTSIPPSMPSITLPPGRRQSVAAGKSNPDS